jgi:hypothetical protein
LKNITSQLANFKRILPLATALCALGTSLFMQSCGSGEGSKFVASKADSLPDIVDFNLHVRPIMSDKCFNCHGPDANKREAGLRLDTPEGAYAALGENKDHYAIVSGNIDKSEVFKRISTTDEKLLMPVPKSNLPKLTSLEIAMIAKWIDQGAEYKPLWSLIQVKKYDVPKVKDEKWAKNPIDNFVLARLEKEGLKPSPEAEKERLIRRVSLDLTGLPPTLSEIDNFFKDNSPNAYDKVVDRLLASPRYGEKMASDWMDIAHYADSHGYQDDGYRNTFRWRDWVIKAFNDNKPYDQFTTEQVAGDLLPNPTKDQLIASGFLRQHPQNQEGGIVDEEFRVEYVLDRTNTIGKAYLGLTIECARCHDHKYDPITQKDYYKLSSFFNSIDEQGTIPNFGNPAPTILIPDKGTETQLAFIKRKIIGKEHELNQAKKGAYKEFETWASQSDKKVAFNPGLKYNYTFDQIAQNKIPNKDKKDKKNKFWNFLGEFNTINPENHSDVDAKTKIVDGVKGKCLEFIGDDRLNFYDNQANYQAYDPFSLGFWVKPTQSAKEGQVILYKMLSIFEGFPGYSIILNADTTITARISSQWPANAIAITSAEKLKMNDWNHITITYDGSSKAKGINLFINGAPITKVIEKDNMYKGFRNYYSYAKRYEKLIGYGKDKYIFHVNSNLHVGGRVDNVPFKSFQGGIDELKIFDREISAAEATDLAKDGYMQQLASKQTNKLSAEEKNKLREFYVSSQHKATQQKLTELKDLRKIQDSLQTFSEEVMVSRQLLKPRQTFVLIRGVYDAHGDTVETDTPQNILKFGKDLPKDRLGLAKWLMDSKNPLPARVTVNRYWQMFFGRGLVSSSGDFGNQGELPSHPELLDWLSNNFVESGWNLKATLKLMVTSSTYKQSSKVTPELYAKDPMNILLARAPRFRMTFEMIRDNALAISGLLADTIGGESVFPYQPKGLWEEKTSGRFLTEYVQSHGKDLYKRSLYTFFKRTSPPPTLMTFDASDRSYCVVKKSATNTPLQSLVNLNDPQLLEAARILAEKMIQNGGQTVEDKITYAFRMSTARNPTKKELTILATLYNQELTRFKKNDKSAAGILNSGEAAINRQINAYELAAYTVITHTILNLDETINKS